MNIETNHAAAGVAATTARAEVKQEWYKNPFLLHAAIAVGVVGIALIINVTYPLNFFWKLLVGGGLVFAGSMMAKRKAAPVKMWGNIFKGLGWAIIVIAVLKSGVRLVLERAALEVDQTLTEIATGEQSLSRIGGGNTVYVKVDMRSGTVQTVPLGITAIAVVEMPRPRANSGEVYWVCPTVASPILTTKAELEVVAGAGTFTHQFGLTEGSRVLYAKNGIPKVSVSFAAKAAVKGAPSPCN